MTLAVGWYSADPTVPVMTKITSENKTIKENLLFTKLLADIGEAKSLHTDCPSSPIMKLPRLIAMIDAGKRKL